jgi:hypothetical protein
MLMSPFLTSPQLEHLENALYKQALSTMPLSAFTAANFSASIYDQIKYITHDEEGHVLYLEAGLKAAGAQPVAACNYSFPMTTPRQFIQPASVVEVLGVSAYLAAAPAIANKAYLTAAGSILVTEALHQGAHRDAVYTIASAFIKPCPSTNAALRVMAYPSLTLVSGLPTAVGAVIELEPETVPVGDFFVTLVCGLDIIAVQTQGIKNGMAMVEVPMNTSGQAYAFLTKDNSGSVTDPNVLCRPAIIEVTPGSPTFTLTIM